MSEARIAELEGIIQEQRASISYLLRQQPKDRLRDLTSSEWAQIMRRRCCWASDWWRVFAPVLLLLCVSMPVQAYEDARAYLLATATPGFTMLMQGSVVAIERLHPDFADRLAATIEEARSVGMKDAGVYSAYRPPGFGIGGFKDKFDSLHAYGLAVDMTGIGSPGSESVQLFHRIARKHGVSCVYGPFNPTEWNHCQATNVRVARNFLKSTITADAPRDLDVMWRAGDRILAWIVGAEPTEPVVHKRKASRHKKGKGKVHRKKRRRK